MSIGAIVLKCFGMVTDAAVARVIDRLLETRRECNSEELFKRSFRLAVTREAPRLAHFTEGKTTKEVYVEGSALDAALAGLPADLASLPQGLEQVAATLAPIFSGSLVLCGTQLLLWSSFM
ncbi:MAG TPA: hypothetical protein VNE39_29220 [Planctomycetota bacterium]|nr:hypothetical protein [Planctomycetota bacterium]